MTALSELLPSGGGQGEVNFVATGNISNGGAVVLNSNGTISPVAQVAQNVPLGSEATFNSAAISSCVVRFILTDPNKFVVCYRLESNSYGYAVVGSISGTTISFGTPVVFESTLTSLGYTMEMDPLTAGGFLVAYGRTSGSYYQGFCRSAVVSGTSITFGTVSAQYTYTQGGNPRGIDLAIDPNSTSTTKFVLAWVQYAQYQRVFCRTGQIYSNGNIGLGTVSSPRQQGGAGVDGYGRWPTAAFDSKNAGEGIITWSQSGGVNLPQGINQRRSFARPFTWSSGSPIFGEFIEYMLYGTYGTTYSPAIKANPFVAGQYVIAFGMEFGNFYGAAVGLSVASPGSTSSSIISGPQIIFTPNSYATYPPNGGGSQERTVSIIFSRTQPNTFVAAWCDSSTEIKMRVGLINPTSNELVFATESTSDTGSDEWVSVDMPISGEISIVCYQDLTNSSSGKVRLGQIAVNNVFDTIGVAGAAISSGATGPINVFGGVNTQQSSLAIGTEYYAQPDGTISATSTYPAKRLGRAVNATTINMKDLT